MTQTMKVPRLLLVGPWTEAEFQVVRQEIDPSGMWPILPSLDESIGTLGNAAEAPELLLLAQPRPGYYRRSNLQRMMTVAPLARMILVAGSWCEGELRTGTAPEGVLRLYWYELASWWRRALEDWTAGKSPLWSDPPSAGPLERILLAGSRSGDAADRDSGQTVQNSESGEPAPKGLVEIDAIDFDSFDALSATLIPHGWSTLWQPRGRPSVSSTAPVAGIWDGGQFDPPELDQLSAFCQGLRDKAMVERSVPVVVLLDFPRQEHYAMAGDVGVSSILAKPYRIGDLVDQLGAG